MATELVKSLTKATAVNGVTRLLFTAGEVTAAIHGVDAAMKAREEFVARFSKRTFSQVANLPTVKDPNQPVTEVVKALGIIRIFRAGNETEAAQDVFIRARSRA